MDADPRTADRPAPGAVEPPATTCTKCPVCGNEECLVLEELGAYCATMTAVSLAVTEEAAPEG